jgi:hypothetical protein
MQTKEPEDNESCHMYTSASVEYYFFCTWLDSFFFFFIILRTRYSLSALMGDESYILFYHSIKKIQSEKGCSRRSR